MDSLPFLTSGLGYAIALDAAVILGILVDYFWVKKKEGVTSFSQYLRRRWLQSVFFICLLIFAHWFLLGY